MTSATRPDLTTRLVNRLINGILGIQPLFNIAKTRARNLMIERAETIGVPWRAEAARLQARDWQTEFAAVNNSDLKYPDYYLKPFHAYSEGNLGWSPATEVEVAAYAVHAKIWPAGDRSGDPNLRASYHSVLQQTLPQRPQDILDLGCSVGMSTFAMQDAFPGSKLTGVDLSPYFLAVAQYRDGLRQTGVGNGLQLEAHTCDQTPATWVHAAAEATGLPDQSYDLVSACLMFHELPQAAAVDIFREARRLLRPGGHLAIMDMNPRSEIYAKMPPYILTLLKSTEPYLDDYFSLDIETAMAAAGFTVPKLVANTPRHRTLIAQVK
jgi:ubiquinone/menaquinone biosynthesis C-methylase UbiE